MKRFLLIIGLLAVAASVGWLVSAWQGMRVGARMSKLDNDIDDLFAGIQEYRKHLGCYPLGSNANIARALKGGNPKSIIILLGRKNELNEQGEYVDPWGTPLRVYFSDSSVLVRSAGPNKRFDDGVASRSDDYFRSN
jgi:hypothetical protein